MIPSARRTWLVLLAGLGAVACEPAPPPGPWNVVIVLVDTLRADHLSLYGYGRPTSPRLEELARESVVFEQARSQAGCTFPSVASLLTSRHPNEIMAGIGRHGMAVPPDLAYLPELLARHGYATAAVSASVIVRDTPSEINRQGGYGRGFDAFDEGCLDRGAPCVNGRALELVDKLPEPWLLYLHYMEPHAPYRPPRWHERRFAHGRPERSWVAMGEPARIHRKLYEGATEIPFDRGDLAHFVDLYDEEVRFLDGQLAALLEGLRDRGVFDRTLLVLLSDHGEELLDHHHFGHCRDLAYETLLRTPLLIRLPGGNPSGRRQRPVDNLDVAPTLLDYLNVDVAPGTFVGQSLRPVIEGTADPAPRYHFAAQGTVRSVTDGRFKLRVDLAKGEAVLHDLELDPGEERDLLATRPDQARRLRAELFAWVRAAEGADLADAVRRAREHQGELEALGYL